MVTTRKPFLDLTAEDVMSREVVTIPRRMLLRDVARVLRRESVSGVPVVDEEGRCIGVLCEVDVLRWARDERPGVMDTPGFDCPYQVKGRLLTGEEAVICALAEGACPLQGMRPVTAGRHTAVCLRPLGVSSQESGVKGCGK